MIPGTDACCILLYGDIGEYDDNVRSGDIARELLEAEALTGKVDVRINSNGGEVYSGIAIFNALKNSKADITIYVDGIAASMASVIALCGKPVQMSRYARLMLHSVQGGCYGNKDEMKDCIREIEALEDTLARCMPPVWARTRRKSARCILTARITGCVPTRRWRWGLSTVFMTLTRYRRTVPPNKYFKYSITGCTSHKTRIA